MRRAFKELVLSVMATCLVAPLSTGTVQAMEKPQEWELVNPAGIVEKAFIAPADRITDLEGKTVVLRWNGKHNGNILLDKLAVKLSEQYPNTKVVKAYVEDGTLNGISGNAAESERVAKALQAMRPDIVIASQCD